MHPIPSSELELLRGRVAELERQLATRSPLPPTVGPDQMLRSLLAYSPSPIFVVDRSGRYLLVNRAWEEMSGLRREEALGREVDELWPAVVARPFMESIRWVVDTALPLAREQSVEFTDGRRYYHVVQFPLLGDQGAVESVASIAYDITSRRTAECALLESHRTLQSFYDSAGFLMGVVELLDDDILHISDNSATERFMGVAPGSTAYLRATELAIPLEHIRTWLARYREAEQTGAPVRFEYAHGERWLSATVAFLGCSPEGRMRCSYVVEDTTEQQRSQERLRLALESANMIAWEFDATTDKVLLQIGDVPKVLGYPSERIATAGQFFALLHAEDRPRVAAALEHNLQHGTDWEIEYRLVQPDGSIRWFRDQGRPQRNTFGVSPRRISGVVRDITGRKQLDERLEQSEQRLRAIFQGVFQFIGLMTPDGTLIEVNRSALEFGGLCETDVLGMKLWDTFWCSATPDTQERFRQATLRAAAGEVVRFDIKVRGAGGHPLWIDFSLSPTRDESGRIVFLVPDGRNIADRKHAEDSLRWLNDNLQQFAYAISHDLQEPLRSVTAFSQILMRGYGDRLDQEAIELLGFVSDGAVRVEHMIRDLLAYARAGAEDQQRMRREVSCAEALAVVQRNLHAAIAESGATVTHDRLPTVWGNATQLTQVLQNLISNAIKFRCPDRRMQVHVSAEREGACWVICVRDNGKGFDPAQGERIFGIFKRVHGRGTPGTGIGLALCRRIIEQHGGRIWAESQPGEGSTFRFSLPNLEGLAAGETTLQLS